MAEGPGDPNRNPWLVKMVFMCLLWFSQCEDYFREKVISSGTKKYMLSVWGPGIDTNMGDF